MIWLALTGLPLAVLVALVVALSGEWASVLNVLSPVLWPLAVAGVLAYLLDPVVDFSPARGRAAHAGDLFVFLAGVGVLAGLLASVVPQSRRRDARTREQRFPTYTRNICRQSMENSSRIHPRGSQDLFTPADPPHQPNPPRTRTNAPLRRLDIESRADLQSRLPLRPRQYRRPVCGARPIARTLAAPDWLGEDAAGSRPGLVAGRPVRRLVVRRDCGAGVGSDLRVLFPAGETRHRIEMDRLSAGAGNPEFKKELVFVLNSINDYLIAFFRGQVLVAMCDGVLYTIGFLIIGLPYAVLIGVMATFLTIIPFLGAIATCVAALLIALVSSGDWQQPARRAGRCSPWCKRWKASSSSQKSWATAWACIR